MSFSFGSPASAPATSGLSSGFNFGANKPATPGFGLTATTQASTGLFGSTPATSAPTFGGTGTFGAGAAFGVTNTPAFGANTATPAFGTPAPAFGATSIAPAFGANATPTFGATSAAPAFGATNPPAFGATTAAPAFGAATTPAFGATTPAFGTATPAFGTTTPAFGTTTPAFGTTTSAFGTTTPAFGTTTPAFGTTTPAFGTTTPAFGAATPAFGTTGLGTGGLNFGTGTNLSTTSTGLTLGAPAATTATGLGGLGGFGFNTTTQSTGLGFFTNPTTSSAGFLGARLGTTTATGTLISTSVTPSVGLGGVAPVGVGAANTTGSDGKSEPPKQMKLPNEVSTTIDTFKDFVKKQKSLSSDVMRISIKPLHKVAREAEATIRLALSLSGEVSKARAHSRRLRSAAAAALANAESVAITPGSELEGTAPPSYVKELIAELEQQLITFRRQMDVADKQMQASPKLLTEQELTLGIRRMHESLVALAGRLQAVHTQVEAQKEQYLNLRKYVLKDPTNVFDTPTANTSLDQILRDAEGTRKKTKSSHVTSSHQGSAVLSDPRAVLGSLQQLAGPTPFTYIGNNALSPYPTADTTGKGPSWQPQPQPTMNTPLNATFGSTLATDTSTFQLQKPPGKRGKQ